MPVNVEIKARCSNPDQVRLGLLGMGADYRGIDHQIDTYFAVKEGRMKLREGNIENNLIYYKRSDSAEPARSDIELFPVKKDMASLKRLLTHALDVLIVVDKRREIYFIDNVKFHIDRIEKLGSFVEIEAIDTRDERTEQALLEQVERYMEELDLREENLEERSYSDLLLERSDNTSD